MVSSVDGQRDAMPDYENNAIDFALAAHTARVVCELYSDVGTSRAFYSPHLRVS